MLRKFIHTVAKPRHPWRSMKFDELAEIYTSISLRSLGFGIIGIFVPIYLYTSGVTIRGILLFLSLFFILRVPVSFAAAHIIGRIGPKHTIALSTVAVVMFLLMLLSYDVVGWPLGLLAGVFTIANGLFYIAYHIDFSKVKDKDHGGKELGWLLIFEQAGRAAGPVVGGVLAGIFAPEVTLAIAIAVLCGSLIPLFLTNEPLKVHQRVSFKGFRLRQYTRDFVAVSSFELVLLGSRVLWPLLLAVFIFTDDTYASIGIVVGAGIAVSMFSARMYGRFIDSNRGHYLLRYGVVMGAVLFVSKSLITAPGGAVAASTLGQPIILAHRMPLSVGMYDAADGAQQFRIVYIVWHQIFSALAKCLLCVGALVATYHFDEANVLRWSMAAVAAFGFFMLVQRFPALKKA